jgi:hypothetical protein
MNSYYHEEKSQKERTVQLVKEWVKYDNDIRKLQKEISNRKKERAILSHDLMNIMKETNTGCYELKNGVLMYSIKNVKKPMTKKVLFEVLQKYYNGDVIKAEQLNEFIMNNREEMVQEKLVRKIDAVLDG